MNTRRIGTTGAVGLLISAIMITGCSSSDPDSATPASEQPIVSTGDTGSRDIVFVVDTDASLKENYTTISGLAGSRNVVAIVRGTVSATQDVYLEQFAYRLLSVDVTEVLYGKAGKQISVLEDGGVVPYAKVLPNISKINASPAPSNPAGYADFRFMGSRHSETGDEVVLFLGVNPNSGTPIDTEYFIVSSVNGRFTLDRKTDEFVRALGGEAGRISPPGFVKSADLETLKSEIAATPR